MNNVEDLTGNPELDREKGIDLFYSNKENIIYPKLLVGKENSNAVWTNKKLKTCPNQGFLEVKKNRVKKINNERKN